MTIVSIHQPQYLPWLPYFDKVAASDIFVYLDNVQFQKNGVQNRNQIKTSQGAIWLTVPVKASLELTIAQTPVVGSQWQRKHTRSIQQNYAKAEFRDRFDTGLLPILQEEWNYLADLNIAVTEWMFNQLGIQAKRVRASELGVTGSKTDLVLSICKALGATAYISGQGAKNYQDVTLFRQTGIEVVYQNYYNQPYRQCYPEKGFVSALSALDVILNMGAQARDVMLAGRK